jgi:uncharacterized protein (DUF1501 family)
MKRRNFLRTAGLATALTPFAYNGFSINPLSPDSMLSRLGAAGSFSDRIMVFIELNGGNDGLNTVIPLDQYSTLSSHRPKILIPENQTLALSGVSGTALHPALAEVREMFDDGMVSMVQTVGYPNQDYSHFRSMDIWMTAADSDESLTSGWLGRMLDNEYPGYPTGYPNTDSPDPLAINIGSVAPVALMGSGFPMGISIGNPEDVYNLINDFIEPAPNTPYGDELTYIRTVMQNTKVYFDVIKDAASMGQNLSALYPAEGENSLADQLRIVARLINGGLTTPVYLVSLNGFDTHSEQVEAGATATGAHAELLRTISKAVHAFMDDIDLMGKADNVCAMTFSEFGRTIAGNDSFGTDHGAAAPLLVFGKGVNPGIIGANPNIPQNLDVSADVPMQHDFRSVYASVLQDWFGLDNAEQLLFGDFPILPIFKGAVGIKNTPGRNVFEVGNFPNPVHAATTITFSIPAARVQITLLDAQGRNIRTIAEGNYPAGVHKVVFNRDGLPSGAYYYVLKVNGLGVTKKLLVL